MGNLSTCLFNTNGPETQRLLETNLEPRLIDLEISLNIRLKKIEEFSLGHRQQIDENRKKIEKMIEMVNYTNEGQNTRIGELEDSMQVTTENIHNNLISITNLTDRVEGVETSLVGVQTSLKLIKDAFQ